MDIKLPLEIAEHPLISQVFHYIQQSSIMFSSLLYRPKGNDKLFLIHKKESTPYF